MRSNRKILFGLLMILGAFLFYRAFRLLSNLGGSSRPVVAQNGGVDPNLQTVAVKAPTGHIAKARVDIPANSIVTPDMMYMAPYTGPSTKGFVTDIESQGAGFITSHEIPKDGQIRPDLDFIGHISQTGIAGLLKPGTRGMIVPIANKPTLHDLVRIGNFVDVLAAFDGQESRTLVENVRVLGVDVSANDYPNVNAAMRGSFKAAPKTDVPAGEPGAGAAVPGAAPAPAPQPGGAPAPTPTPAPANAPRPDPALILEVTPRQAASIQLALASNAPLDFLVRPALPSNRSVDPVPVTDTVGSGGIVTTATTGTSGAGASLTRSVSSQAVSVTKPQIAPYAEAHKTAGNKTANALGKTMLTALSKAATGSSGGGNATRIPRGGRRPVELIPPPLPPLGSNGTSTPFTPPSQSVTLSGRSSVPSFKPAPAPVQTYNIPVYGDGKILRTETVPLPAG